MAINLGVRKDSEVNETININSSENLITLADGRVYLKGGVTETDLTTYPDATAGFAYTGTSFTTQDAGSANNPEGITWDGTYFWVLNYPDSGFNARIYKYNAAGVYQNVYLQTNQNYPQDLVWDGTYFWVMNSGVVYKYNSSGTYQNVSWNAGFSTATGIAWDGTYFWVTDNGSDKVYKFNSSGVYQSVNFSLQGASPQAITWDGTYFWTLDNGTDLVYKYNASFVYQNVSFSIGSQTTEPRGLVSVGAALWALGSSTDTAFKYQNQIGVNTNGSASQIAEGLQNYVRIK
jgi:hypothetical protein|tara:strand:+ start:295 stop:1164 length:870 start_codon:yes stop_codon:yes gene_type:complete